MFADAIAAGGSSAEDAVAALVYATQDSGCLSFDKLFKFVPIPPDNCELPVASEAASCAPLRPCLWSLSA